MCIIILNLGTIPEDYKDTSVMPSVIRVLDELTINQIAAGEVIEQAASVVKEMIENSLDAQASEIMIEIKGGGRQLIRITDNGIGMDAKDALACFQRHATSKLCTIEDFDSLASMGFRGEALAAIASVAKVKLVTRSKDQEVGTLVQIEGGVLKSTAQVPCELGTSLEVADLFFNVPARRKFLKSPAYDQQEIQKGVMHAALAYPQVQFRLIADGETLLDVAKCTNLLERASLILHPEMMENMIPIAYVEGDMKIEGVIGKPSHNRPNRTGQTLLVNQRPVVSLPISHAILEGYGTALPERRFPVFMLTLSMPPSRVDVNVHPQKKEVRFRHEGELKDHIRKAILNHIAIPSSPILFKLDTPSPIVYEIPAPKASLVQEKWVQAKAEPRSFPVQTTPPLLFESEPELFPEVLGTVPHYVLIDRPPLKNEKEEGVCFLDCEKARKRILYEQAHTGMKKGSIEKQILLLPLPLSLSQEEAFQLKEHLPKVETMGFGLINKGKSKWIVEQIPSFLKAEDIETVLKGVLETISNQNKGQDLFHQLALISTSRLKAQSVHLSLEEAKLLVKALFKCQQPYFSPTGQPILAWIPQADLLRYFK